MAIRVVYSFSFGLLLSEEVCAVLLGMGISNPDALPRHDLRLVRAVEMFPAAGVGIATLRGDRYRLATNDRGDEVVEEPDDIKWVEVTCTCQHCPVHEDVPPPENTRPCPGCGCWPCDCGY